MNKKDITIRIPAPLRKITEGEEIVKVTGESVKEAITNLIEKYPELKERIYQTKNGEVQIRNFINIFLNQEDIRFLEGEYTTLSHKDELSIIPAIAGG